MNTYNFIFNSINTTIKIKDYQVEITFPHPRQTNIVVKLYGGVIERHLRSRKIIVKDLHEQHLHSNGEIISNKQLPIVVYDDIFDKTIARKYYSSFMNLLNTGVKQGDIEARLVANALLKQKIEFFKKPIFCFDIFNATHPLQFVKPIDTTITTIDSTNSNGAIIVTINNPSTGVFTATLKTLDGVIVGTLTNTLSFNNLQTGEYLLFITDSNQNNFTMWPEKIRVY